MTLEAVNTTFGTIGGQNYHYANAVIDKETGDVMNLKKLLKHPKYMEVWTRAAANEYGRLFQGCGRNDDGTQRVVGTNACHWIRKNQIPKGKTATYNQAVASVRPEKADPNRVRFVAGGDRTNLTRSSGDFEKIITLSLTLIMTFFIG